MTKLKPSLFYAEIENELTAMIINYYYWLSRKMFLVRN